MTTTGVYVVRDGMTPAVRAELDRINKVLGVVVLEEVPLVERDKKAERVDAE